MIFGIVYAIFEPVNKETCFERPKRGKLTQYSKMEVESKKIWKTLYGQIIIKILKKGLQPKIT